MNTLHGVPAGSWIYITVLTSSVALMTDAAKNILFLVADDMRPEIGAYLGPDFPSPVHPAIHTPNLDQLASRSALLKRAYVQQALCGPSRSSLLTSRRPDTTHVYDLKTYWRRSGGNFTTIPQFFKEQGYLTQGMGKIFHPGRSSNHDDPISWTEPYFHATNYDVYENHLSWTAVPKATTDEYPLVDQQIASHAIQALRSISATAVKRSRPFFLAVGFHRPHLPFQFPDEYLKYYPLENIRLPPNAYVPKNFPRIAWNSCGGLSAKKDIKKMNATLAFNTTVPDKTAVELRRAYYASVSYTDGLIGMVIQELQQLGLDKDTIISFWGDHGWQLGEHNEWCKQTNFELATHAPMMIHVPDVTDDGIVIEELTEFVDLFPTLVEAAGFKAMETCSMKSAKTRTCTEGMSMVPLFNKTPDFKWKTRVFSQYPRTNGKRKYMGYTMRTDRYRYTEWVRVTGRPYYRIKWDKKAGVELYDHQIDPEENVNVYREKAYEVTVKELSKQLHDGWRKAIPNTKQKFLFGKTIYDENAALHI